MSPRDTHPYQRNCRLQQQHSHLYTYAKNTFSNCWATTMTVLKGLPDSYMQDLLSCSQDNQDFLFKKCNKRSVLRCHVMLKYKLKSNLTFQAKLLSAFNTAIFYISIRLHDSLWVEQSAIFNTYPPIKFPSPWLPD